MDALSHMLREAGKLEKAGAEHGWDVRVTDNMSAFIRRETEVVQVYCKAIRGQELISIWWEEKKLLEAPLYTLGGHQVKLRNASACVQQMAIAPDFEKAARKTKARRIAGAMDLSLEPDPGTLPWEYLEDPTHSEILKACYSKVIIWKNNITEEPETDVIIRSYDPGNRKGNFNGNNYHVSISTEGRRILNFIGVHGFRSVAFDQVLRIGSSQEAADRITKQMLEQDRKERDDKDKVIEQSRKKIYG